MLFPTLFPFAAEDRAIIAPITLVILISLPPTTSSGAGVVSLGLLLLCTTILIRLATVSAVVGSELRMGRAGSDVPPNDGPPSNV
jgi:hypothetical protein